MWRLFLCYAQELQYVANILVNEDRSILSCHEERVYRLLIIVIGIIATLVQC